MKKINWTNTFVCPIYTCFINFPSSNDLKKHISSDHPELEENNLFMNDNGNLTVRPEHMK